MAQYTLRLQTATGQPIDEIKPWHSLRIAASLNAPGTLSLRTPRNGIAWNSLAIDRRIEIWRQAPGVAPALVLDTVWLISDWHKVYVPGSGILIEIQAESPLDLLARRIVYATYGSAEGLKTGAADDIIKEFVEEQAGATAGAGRSMADYLTIAPDLSQGATITKGGSWRNLLQVCQECAAASAALGAPLFLDVVRLSTNQFMFSTFLNQRGVDRTGAAPINLGGDTGALIDGGLVEHHSAPTWVYAGADKYGAERVIGSAPGATSSELWRLTQSPFARREIFHAARTGITTAAEADDEAEAVLRRKRGYRLFSGTVRDLPNVRYGRDWAWGDKVVASFDGELETCFVHALEIEATSGGDEIIKGHLRSAL